MTSTRQLILIDGSSYLFRAFHALPPLVNSRGQPTGAVKGVINMVRALIRQHAHSNIAVVFDASGSTFRNRMYTEYKAHRPPMPDELRCQIQPIHDIIRAMGLPLLVIDGVEADDVIGTLAVQATRNRMHTLISTSDKDLAQLVNDRVTLMNTMTNEVLDVAGVTRKFGIGPSLIVGYLALMGDKVDNIPGVPGVGPKTAVKWLLEYGSLQGIIDHAHQVGGKVGERLRANLDQLQLSRDLATIKLDCSLEVAITDLVAGEEASQQLHDLFSALEFRSWVSELEQRGVTGSARRAVATDHDPSGAADREPVADSDRTEYQCIQHHRQLDQLVAELEGSNPFGLCVEFYGDHFLDAEILGIALSPAPGRGCYIPCGHVSRQGSVEPDQLPLAEVLHKLKPLLENPAITKVGHDLKTQAHVLQNHAIRLQPLKSDVLLASYVLNSVAIRHHLHNIARLYLPEIDLLDIRPLLGRGRGRIPIRQLAIHDFAPYSCQRADLILRLATRLEQNMQSRGQLAGVYRYYETPLIEVLQRMERQGIKLEVGVLEQQSSELAARLDSLENVVYELAGEQFNLSSPRQLQAILFDKLGLPVLKKTPTGQPSTAEPVLQELAGRYELPRLVLEHRSVNKLKSTYTDKLPLEINHQTGRIHSSFQQAVAATGRLSSTDPNLQNIPIRTAAGRRVRQAFVPPPGCKLLAADYSQVELRIMAHLSRDAGLLQAFASDEDVHRVTAAEVFGQPLATVTPEQRRRAKAINFGLIYGMSAFGLANQLNLSRGEAQDYVDRYFDKYPGVKHYMEQTQASADEKGYVETLFGRRLYLPDIHSTPAMREFAKLRNAPPSMHRCRARRRTSSSGP